MPLTQQQQNEAARRQAAERGTTVGHWPGDPEPVSHRPDQPYTGPTGDRSRVPAPGYRLPNGATIIAVREVRGQATVLALTNGLSLHPYVTWRLDVETGEVWGGDYCLTFTGAIRSYAKRSGFGAGLIDEDSIGNVIV